MKRPGDALAARLRATLDARADATRRAEEAERERKERAGKLRQELFSDLVAFGEALGHFRITQAEGALVLEFEGRVLRFEADDSSEELKVDAKGLAGSHRVFWHPALNKWVWSFAPRIGAEQQKVFWDGGLEDLIALVFDLRPDEEAELPPPSADGEDPPKRSL